MLKRTGLMSIALMVAAAGCSSNKTTATTTPPPSQSSFEKMKDPAINAETHFAAAQLAVARGQYVVAQKQDKRCLKETPNHVGATYGMACLHTKTKEYSTAEKDWQKYVTVTGGSAM